jgi:hypothetical protein
LSLRLQNLDPFWLIAHWNRLLKHSEIASDLESAIGKRKRRFGQLEKGDRRLITHRGAGQPDMTHLVHCFFLTIHALSARLFVYFSAKFRTFIYDTFT